ncbi:hypothetical protein MBLNU457_7625t1 [Dothideomycetes sp. NU457]
MSQDPQIPPNIARQIQHRPTESLQAALNRERQEHRNDYDCLSCRVMGATAFLGLGGYTYWSGHRQLTQREAMIVSKGGINMAARRLGITGTAAVLAGIGLYRFFA